MSVFLVFIGLTIIFISANLLLFKEIGLGLIVLLALLWCLPFLLSWCLPFMSSRRTPFWGTIFALAFFLSLLTLMFLSTQEGKDSWYSFLRFLGVK